MAEHQSETVDRTGTLLANNAVESAGMYFIVLKPKLFLMYLDFGAKLYLA